VGRVIAIGPGGKAQAPERSDWCRDVIEQVVTAGLLDGLFLTEVTFATQTEADEFRRAILRSCGYYCSCGKQFCTKKFSNWPPVNGCPLGGQRITGRADVVQVPGEKVYRVQYQLHDKRESILAHVQKYGPDPDKWPYFSGRKRLKEEA
jgi:hypothetical protein